MTVGELLAAIQGEEPDTPVLIEVDELSIFEAKKVDLRSVSLILAAEGHKPRFIGVNNICASSGTVHAVVILLEHDKLD